MEVLLSAENLVAGYQKRPVVQDVSFRVRTGERVLLIGPNGSGKTTLLRILAGTLRPWKGRLVFRDRDLARIPEHLRVHHGLGYLMQTHNIFPSLTVAENLQLAFWHGEKRRDRRREWLLSILPGLRDQLKRRAGLLSGGQRQALAIGMVLARPCKLLLLDEPTAGLDPRAASEILNALREAQETIGFAAVIVEHNLRLVHSWVSRVAVMNQGRLVAEDDDPSVLLDQERLQTYYFQ